MNEIDQLIERGERRLKDDERHTGKLRLHHPTPADYENAWHAFLSKVRTYLPVEVRQYLVLATAVYPDQMPPTYLSECEDLRLVYDGLASIKVHFNATYNQVAYEVANFEITDLSWSFTNAVIYREIDLALAAARRHYTARDLFIDQQR